MKLLHNPRCAKSRQTLALLKENNIQPEIVEYLKNVPTQAELSDIIQKLNISPYQLLRRTESDFKENFKGKELSGSEWISAMVKYPKLIERPIFINGEKARLGRPPEKVLEII